MLIEIDVSTVGLASNTESCGLPTEEKPPGGEQMSEETADYEPPSGECVTENCTLVVQAEENILGQYVCAGWNCQCLESRPIKKVTVNLGEIPGVRDQSLVIGAPACEENLSVGVSKADGSAEPDNHHPHHTGESTSNLGTLLEDAGSEGALNTLSEAASVVHGGRVVAVAGLSTDLVDPDCQTEKLDQVEVSPESEDGSPPPNARLYNAEELDALESERKETEGANVGGNERYFESTLARTRESSPGELSTPEYWSDWYRRTLAVSEEAKRANRDFREMRPNESDAPRIHAVEPSDPGGRDGGGGDEGLLPLELRSRGRKSTTHSDESIVAGNICVSFAEVCGEETREIDKGMELPFRFRTLVKNTVYPILLEEEARSDPRCLLCKDPFVHLKKCGHGPTTLMPYSADERKCRVHKLVSEAAGTLGDLVLGKYCRCDSKKLRTRSHRIRSKRLERRLPFELCGAMHAPTKRGRRPRKNGNDISHYVCTVRDSEREKQRKKPGLVEVNESDESDISEENHPVLDGKGVICSIHYDSGIEAVSAGLILDLPAELLVDTGVTASLVDSRLRPFAVIDRLHVDAILGTDTLKAFRAVIDLDDNVMTLIDSGELPPWEHRDPELNPMVKVTRSLCTLQDGQTIVEICNAATDKLVVKKGTALAIATIVPKSAFEATLLGENTGSDSKHSKASVPYGERAWIDSVISAVASESTPCRDPMPGFQKAYETALEVDFSDSKLDDEQKVLLRDMLSLFRDMFVETSLKPGRTDLLKFTIDTGQHPPIKQRPYRVSHAVGERMESEIQQYLELGLIRPSTSPWASPVLMIRKPDGAKGMEFKWNTSLTVPVISLPFIETVIHYCHSDVFAAHVGQSKTMDKVRKHAYWHGWKRDVAEYVRACTVCGSGKAIDLGRTVGCNVCPLKICLVRSPYLLSMRYSVDNGVPEHLLSDRGSNFISELAKSFYETLGINKLFGDAYHPQTQGLVERFDGTLIGMLLLFVTETQTDWDLYLPRVLFAYRTSYHEALADSPFFSLYGRDPVLPLDLAFLNTKNEWKSNEVAEYRRRLYLSMRDTRRLVERQLIKAQDKHAHRLNGQEVVEFKEGVAVWVYQYFRARCGENKTKKLAFSWHGPYRVVGQLGENTYKIAIPSHPDRVPEPDDASPLTINDLPTTSFAERLALGGEETVFSGVTNPIVEVIDKRVKNRQEQYLVLTASYETCWRSTTSLLPAYAALIRVYEEESRKEKEWPEPRRSVRLAEANAKGDDDELRF
ncbi:unnamed protein product [Phytophthora fragariaefolia]|uniref:Unnamed protein product n=1 Tax=Phytophthora fragariaefolia TaxID=1490495 RepID=A0A9W7CRG4_9STRA|nr:unnamed protein product [Phytophthora fragariaefolia]